MPHHMCIPNTGLSHRSTQLSHRGERILEDVSRRCNHQQSATNLWAKETSRDLLRFGFPIFSGFWRTRLSSDFGEIVLAGRVGFALKISEINKVTKHKFCVSCVLMVHL
jgi:hypothetical protein